MITSFAYVVFRFTNTMLLLSPSNDGSKSFQSNYKQEAIMIVRSIESKNYLNFLTRVKEVHLSPPVLRTQLGRGKAAEHVGALMVIGHQDHCAQSHGAGP